MIIHQIGSGLALFALPQGRFIYATKPLQPLPTITGPMTQFETHRFLKTGAMPKQKEQVA
ncbi:MAG TPA: hypothetical protein VIL30_14415 [Ramlibacter sp.]|jgi:hypothetical protein